jgi:hypothetical protein
LHKAPKSLPLALILSLLVALLSTVPAAAANDVRVNVRDTKDGYFTISNVVEELPAVPMYKANGPVTVTFQGKTLAMEKIAFYPQAELKGTDLYLTGTEEPIKFDVQQYTEPTDSGETQLFDELVREPSFIPLYVAGNRATLPKPGYYLIVAEPEAAAPTMMAVQVLGDSHTAAPVVTAPETASAVPASAKVMVNGQPVSFEAYNITGNNYFKLRDLAAVVNGTEKQFEVTWDGAKNAINLLTGTTYTPAGGELVLSSKTDAQNAALTRSKVYVNGQEVQFTAYQIGNNNYFKLRDVAKVIGFAVTWDAATNTVGIDTKAPYTE